VVVEQSRTTSPEPDAGGGTRIGGPLLAAARLGWLLLTLAAIVLVSILLPQAYTDMLTPCQAPPCDPLRPTLGYLATLREIGLPLETRAAINIGAMFVLAVAYITIGVGIFALRSDDWMAILTSLVLITLGATTSVIYPAARLEPPLRWPALAVEGFLLASLVAALYLFPNGRFVPRWSRWLVLLWVAWVGYSYLFPDAPLSILGMSFAQFLVLRLVWYSGGMVAQVYRFRGAASPAQRQQTKLVLAGIATAFVIFFALELPVVFMPELAGATTSGVLYRLITLPLDTVGLLLIPVAVAISMLHYRLWDVDQLINRTLVYGSLTISLTLIYLLTVTFAQFLVRLVTGQESDLAIIASTLAIAWLLQPLRGRLQRFIDRRFYRRKYDAERVLRGFGAVTRSEIDLDRLSRALIDAADETVQPAHVSLWQRRAGGESERGNA
jgi:hypothetical protein